MYTKRFSFKANIAMGDAYRMFLPIWAEMLEVSNLAGAETGMLSANWAA